MSVWAGRLPPKTPPVPDQPFGEVVTGDERAFPIDLRVLVDPFGQAVSIRYDLDRAEARLLFRRPLVERFGVEEEF